MPIVRLNSEGKTEKRVQNIEEKIYFLCFSKPRSRTEIAEILYGPKSSKNKSAYAYLSGKTGIIEKLADEKIGWLEYLPNYKPILGKGKKIDKRSLNRKYYRSTCKPLISRIEQRTSLDKFEEYIVRDKLNSLFFKRFIGNEIPSDPIKHIISILDILLVIIDENIELRELNIQLSHNIETKKQYNNIKKKMKVIIDKLPELKELLKKDPSKSVENFLIFITIPNILFCKIMRISDLGQTYYQIRNLLRKLSEEVKLDYVKFNGLK